MRKKKIMIIITILLFLFLIGFIGGYFLYQHHLHQEEKQENIALEIAMEAYQKLFTDKKQEIVKLEVTKKEVTSVRKLFTEVKSEDTKKKYLRVLDQIDAFMKVRNEIRLHFVDKVLKSNTTDDDIKKIQVLHKKLPSSYQKQLDEMLNTAVTQRNKIKEVESLITSFFTNDVVKEEIDAVLFTDLKNKLEALPQKDLLEKYTPKINQIQAKLDELEARKKAEIEAERQAVIARALAESERLRKENELIMVSNVILGGVPRINQKEGVLNGCEVASLLMGLQYKGYKQGMTLREIAEAVPKTDDPHTGFILDIWGSMPLDRPHWIAPDALSVFGKTYYDGVTDISGASVEDLKREIDNGNPVIVYGTYGFYNPKGWYGEVPINLHVMLMVGYNKRTGNIIINDPWGGVEMIVSGSSFAAQYNLMHYAVAIR